MKSIDSKKKRFFLTGKKIEGGEEKRRYRRFCKLSLWVKFCVGRGSGEGGGKKQYHGCWIAGEKALGLENPPPPVLATLSSC